MWFEKKNKFIIFFIIMVLIKKIKKYLKKNYKMYYNTFKIVIETKHNFNSTTKLQNLKI